MARTGLGRHKLADGLAYSSAFMRLLLPELSPTLLLRSSHSRAGIAAEFPSFLSSRLGRFCRSRDSRRVTRRRQVFSGFLSRRTSAAFRRSGVGGYAEDLDSPVQAIALSSIRRLTICSVDIHTYSIRTIVGRTIWWPLVLPVQSTSPIRSPGDFAPAYCEPSPEVRHGGGERQGVAIGGPTRNV